MHLAAERWMRTRVLHVPPVMRLIKWAPSVPRQTRRKAWWRILWDDKSYNDVRLSQTNSDCWFLMCGPEDESRIHARIRAARKWVADVRGRVNGGAHGAPSRAGTCVGGSASARVPRASKGNERASRALAPKVAYSQRQQVRASNLKKRAQSKRFPLGPKTAWESRPAAAVLHWKPIESSSRRGGRGGIGSRLLPLTTGQPLRHSMTREHNDENAHTAAPVSAAAGNKGVDGVCSPTGMSPAMRSAVGVMYCMQELHVLRHEKNSPVDDALTPAPATAAESAVPEVPEAEPSPAASAAAAAAAPAASVPAAPSVAASEVAAMPAAVDRAMGEDMGDDREGHFEKDAWSAQDTGSVAVAEGASGGAGGPCLDDSGLHDENFQELEAVAQKALLTLSQDETKAPSRRKRKHFGVGDTRAPQCPNSNRSAEDSSMLACESTLRDCITTGFASSGRKRARPGEGGAATVSDNEYSVESQNGVDCFWCKKCARVFKSKHALEVCMCRGWVGAKSVRMRSSPSMP